MKIENQQKIKLYAIHRQVQSNNNMRCEDSIVRKLQSAVTFTNI